ncbi:Cache 3/Cache 2 fusion domain-containing protein, partial [Luteimonas sp. Y-2-2-4F]
MSWFHRLTLGNKLAAVVTLSVAVMLFVLAALVYMNSRDEIETRARADLDSANLLMSESIELYHQDLMKKARDMSGALGAMMREPVRLDAGDRVRIGEADTPSLWLGDRRLNQDFGLVDLFEEKSGAVPTFFARDGDDFVRVSTALRDRAGARVIGTTLDHAHPAYARVLEGQDYAGPATLFGDAYMTHYQPLRDAAGQTVGIVSIVENYTQGLAALRTSMREAVLGTDGYFMVLQSRDDGSPAALAVHPHAEGKGLDAVVDAADLAAFRALLDAGRGSGEFRLRAAEGEAYAPSFVSVSSFAPWGWTIVAVEPRSAVTAAATRLLRSIALLSIGALLAIAALTWLAMRRLVSRPLARAIEVADAVSAGELDNRIETGRQDEVGRLMGAMARMQSQLRAVVAALGEMAQRHDAGEIHFRMDDGGMPGSYGGVVRDTNALVASHVALKLRLVEIMKRYAVGDLSQDMERLPGDKAVLTDTMDAVKANLGAINVEIRRLVDAAAAGDFGVRGDERRFEHDFHAMVSALNRLMATADGNLAELSRLLQALAEGDLSHRMDGQFHGVFATMRDDANRTAEQLTRIVGR